MNIDGGGVDFLDVEVNSQKLREKPMHVSKQLLCLKEVSQMCFEVCPPVLRKTVAICIHDIVSNNKSGDPRIVFN